MWFLSEETNQPRRRRCTVADELRIGLQELLRKAQVEGEADFLREDVRALSQAIMEMASQTHLAPISSGGGSPMVSVAGLPS